MANSSSLIEDHRPLVLDTSVLINLHGSSFGEHILGALPNNIIVPRTVAEELEHETSRNNGEHSFLNNMITDGKLQIVDLLEEEFDLYANLVSGSPSLDDGEATAIALAANRNLLPVIDEKKGRARAKVLIKNKAPAWSLDIFLHPKVEATLGSSSVVEAIYLALRNTRMRIHEDSCDDVVSLIGYQRALECRCLPGYKMRRSEWARHIASIGNQKG